MQRLSIVLLMVASMMLIPEKVQGQMGSACTGFGQTAAYDNGVCYFIHYKQDCTNDGQWPAAKPMVMPSAEVGRKLIASSCAPYASSPNSFCPGDDFMGNVRWTVSSDNLALYSNMTDVTADPNLAQNAANGDTVVMVGHVLDPFYASTCRNGFKVTTINPYDYQRFGCQYPVSCPNNRKPTGVCNGGASCTVYTAECINGVCCDAVADYLVCN